MAWSYPEQQTVTTVYRVLGEETVETPAGTFDALKIDTRSTTHKTAPSFGNGIDHDATTIRYAQWWVRGVGLVMLMGNNGSATTTVMLVKFQGADVGTSTPIAM